MMKMKATWTLSICLGFSIGLSDASTKGLEESLDVQLSPFQLQAEQIRSDLQENEQYAELSPEGREKVLSLLVSMEALLNSADSVDGMPMQSKVDLFNHQEEINTILTGARADSRMVCRREVTTGSHRKQQNCMTVAERERRRQRDYDAILNQARSTPTLRPGL